MFPEDMYPQLMQNVRDLTWNSHLTNLLTELNLLVLVIRTMNNLTRPPRPLTVAAVNGRAQRLWEESDTVWAFLNGLHVFFDQWWFNNGGSFRIAQIRERRDPERFQVNETAADVMDIIKADLVRYFTSSTFLWP
jgi:hypothetical protein